MIPMVNDKDEDYENPSKTNTVFEIDIDNDEEINHWGYLCYQRHCGWYIIATEEGE